MQDYTIGEYYTLPSKGNVYDGEVRPDIKIRSMTTNEELKRLASVEEPYRNISEIIDDCIVEGPGLSSYDMCIGDYQFLLHKLRVVTYGPEYPVANVCKYCGCETKDVINLDELPVIEYTEDYEKYREFDLPKSGHHIRLRPITPRMLDLINVKALEAKKKSKGKAPDMALIYTMEQIIESVNGERPNPVKFESWLRNLPMADTNAIIQYSNKMNELIGVDVNLECTCDICGLNYHTTLRTTSEFFRPSLNFGR